MDRDNNRNNKNLNSKQGQRNVKHTSKPKGKKNNTQNGGSSGHVSTGKNNSKNNNKTIHQRQSTSYSDYLVIGVILVFILWFAISSMKNLESAVATADVVFGELSVPKEIDALVIREERVYNASSDGEFVYEALEGERVAKGSEIAYLTDEEGALYMEEAMQQIEDENITVSSLLRNFNGNSEYVKNLNDTITSKIKNRNYSNFSDFYALKDSIEYTVGLRNNFLLTSSEDFDMDKYNENIAKSREFMFAENSGIVSYSVDGYESNYSTQDFSTITENDITIGNENILKSNTYTVSQGDAVFKIVESNVWYIASYVDNEQITTENLIEGNKKEIYVYNGYEYKEYNSKIHQIISGESESLVIFEMYSNVQDFLDIRSTKIKTSLSEYYGYKIPTSSITQKETLRIKEDFVHYEENQAGSTSFVYFSKADGSVEKILVDVYRESVKEGYVVILEENTNLAKGDILLKDVDSEEQFQIGTPVAINGVLVVNSGIATFREIFIDESLGTSTSYTILPEDENTNIRQYDIIVEDATVINDGELVY
ncbi:MAG: HlyD family efflux transporter periplasmic adaptor subunit [Lachnospirales bacterium]